MTDSPAQTDAKADAAAEEILDRKQKRVLKAVSIIKSTMFVVEAASGYFAHSMSMIADSFDMLQDALGAGASHAVQDSHPRKQALVALGKAAVMAVGGFGVLGAALFFFLNPIALPATAVMAIVGGIAFGANLSCAALLYRHRNDNLNMKSTWKGIRNDGVSNIGVLTAAAIGHFFITPIPDLIVGAVVSCLCIHSAWVVAKDARKILRSPEGRKKQKPGKTAATRKPSQKIVLGFKKVLHIFNNKAATDQKTPVAAPAQQVPVRALPAGEPVIKEPAGDKQPVKPGQPTNRPLAPA